MNEKLFNGKVKQHGGKKVSKKSLSSWKISWKTWDFLRGSGDSYVLHIYKQNTCASQDITVTYKYEILKIII